jgi:hypothetical protein
MAADKRVSDLVTLTGANTATNDLIYVVDVSEPLPGSRSKKMTVSEIPNTPAGTTLKTFSVAMSVALGL